MAILFIICLLIKNKKFSRNYTKKTENPGGLIACERRLKMREMWH